MQAIKNIHYKNKNKLAKLRGAEAKAVLDELDRGAGILFSAYVDKNNNPVVELYRDGDDDDNI